MKKFVLFGLVFAMMFADEISNLETSCEKGDGKSCYELGLLYGQNRKVIVDNSDNKDRYNKAIQYFEKGCNGNNAEACAELSSYYDNGFG